MPDDPDPPRRFYGLKAKEFEAVNSLPRSPGENPPTTGPGSSPAPTERIEVSDLIRSANVAGPTLPAPTAAAPNDVHRILRDNLSRANAAGLNQLESKPPRKSRRQRDYWILMAGAGAVFGTIIVRSGPQAPVPFLFALAGLVVSTIGLTWVLWFVMDDY